MNRKYLNSKTATKLKSPEDLNKVIRTANPLVWIIIILILIGLIIVLVWSFTVRLESKVSAVSLVDNQIGIKTYILNNDYNKIKKNQVLRINNREYTVDQLETNQYKLDYLVDDLVILKEIEISLGWSKNDLVYVVSSNLPSLSIDNGYYFSHVITESIAPIRFIFN